MAEIKIPAGYQLSSRGNDYVEQIRLLEVALGALYDLVELHCGDFLLVNEQFLINANNRIIELAKLAQNEIVLELVSFSYPTS